MRVCSVLIMGMVRGGNGGDGVGLTEDKILKKILFSLRNCNTVQGHRVMRYVCVCVQNSYRSIN